MRMAMALSNSSRVMIWRRRVHNSSSVAMWRSPTDSRTFQAEAKSAWSMDGMVVVRGITRALPNALAVSMAPCAATIDAG